MDNFNNGDNNSAYNNSQNAQYGNQYNSYGNGPTPSSVYDNARRNNDPYYHYGMPRNNFADDRYLEEQRRRVLIRRHHEKNIKKLGNQVGAALLLLLFLNSIFSVIVIIPKIAKLYMTSVGFQSAIGILFSVVTVGGAFYIYSKFSSSSKRALDGLYSVPNDKLKTVLIILISFGGCFVANYITSVLRAVFEAIGVYSSYTAIEDPSSTADVILIFLGTAVIPPLVEEFAIRGVVMQNLRKYGNGFAILASAFVFAILHGNAVQIPFAFLCGLFLGYAVIATNSLWTSIIIHALVNSASFIYSAVSFYADEQTATVVYGVLTTGGIIVGVLALILYCIRYKKHKILGVHGTAPEIPLKTKFGKFVSSPVMIISIVLFALEAVATLSLSAN